MPSNSYEPTGEDMKIAHRKGQLKRKTRERALRKEKLIKLGVLKSPDRASPAAKK
jgi:hypothetical protein